MAKRAWCSGCGGYVALNQDEACPGGHPRSCLRAIEEVADNAIPSVTVRRAPVPVTLAPDAALGDMAGSPGWNDYAGVGVSGLSTTIPPSYVSPAAREAVAPQPVLSLSESNVRANWIMPVAIAGSLLLAFALASASPLAGLVLGGFLLGTLLSAVTLWVGMKLTGAHGSIIALLAISAICGAVQLVPFVGGIMSFIVMLALISRWIRIPVWPDAVLMVVVARVVALFAAVVLIGMFMRF